MGRIPGARIVVVGEPGAVDMAEHGLAELAALPAVAGHVDVAGEGAAFAVGAGQRVMPVGREADAGHPGAALGERGVARELVAGAVEIVDVLGDLDALHVLPRAGADTVAGVDALALRR